MSNANRTWRCFLVFSSTATLFLFVLRRRLTLVPTKTYTKGHAFSDIIEVYLK